MSIMLRVLRRIFRRDRPTVQTVDPERQRKFAWYEQRLTNRRWRLLWCANCRWHQAEGLLTQPFLQEAVELAERFADGLAELSELEECYRQVCTMQGELARTGAREPFALSDVYYATQPHGEFPFDGLLMGTTISQQCGPDKHPLTADILGDPDFSMALEPAWRTDTVMALARVIYEQRQFGDMPILADALEEAGCTNRDLLDHCRDGLEHYRGCWALDLVLGKS